MEVLFMQLTGSEIIAECLLEQGVDTVFGYPGGAVLNIYDALSEGLTRRLLPPIPANRQEGTPQCG